MPAAAPTAERPRSRARRWLLAAAALLVVVGVGAALWLLAHTGTGQRSAAAATPPRALTAARAQQLSVQLSSGDEKQVRAALVLPDEQPLDPGLVPGLASMHLALDPHTYRPTGADSATVDATGTGPAGARTAWVCDLELVDGTWRILDTTPKQGG